MLGRELQNSQVCQCHGGRRNSQRCSLHCNRNRYNKKLQGGNSSEEREMRHECALTAGTPRSSLLPFPEGSGMELSFTAAPPAQGTSSPLTVITKGRESGNPGSEAQQHLTPGSAGFEHCSRLPAGRVIHLGVTHI